jgi:hypothetical protein
MGRSRVCLVVDAMVLSEDRPRACPRYVDDSSHESMRYDDMKQHLREKQDELVWQNVTSMYILYIYLMKQQKCYTTEHLVYLESTECHAAP